jgi:hypothetical protein
LNYQLDITGPPGFVCAVFKKTKMDSKYGGLCTRLLAWGVFNDLGQYQCLVPEQDDFDEVNTTVYKPEMASHFEEHWDKNTEDV